MSNNNSENLDELFAKEPESIDLNAVSEDDAGQFPTDEATSVFKFDEQINISKYDPNKHSSEAQNNAKPKKKKRKHLESRKVYFSSLRQKLEGGQTVFDYEVRQALQAAQQNEEA